MSDPTMKTTSEVLADRDLTGATVLITGATTGIGKETARALAEVGATVVITGRSDEKGKQAVAELREAVPDGSFSYEVLELGSLASVRAFTDRFLAEHDQLDVLVANAGIMAVPFGNTDDGFELQFGTNHLGHFVLIGRLLPLLVSSAPARVILLSSGGHAASDIGWDDPNFISRPYSKLEAYGQSKTANVLHAVEIDRRFRDQGVHAWSVHPGMVKTDLGRHFTSEDYAELVERAKVAGGELPRRVGVEVGAATSVWAATTDEALSCGGSYLADCAVAEARNWATDPAAARRLWALSEELVGESFPEMG